MIYGNVLHERDTTHTMHTNQPLTTKHIPTTQIAVQYINSLA